MSERQILYALFSVGYLRGIVSDKRLANRWIAANEYHRACPIEVDGSVKAIKETIKSEMKRRKDREVQGKL